MKKRAEISGVGALNERLEVIMNVYSGFYFCDDFFFDPRVIEVHEGVALVSDNG